MLSDEAWTSILRSDRAHVQTMPIIGELNYWARVIGFQQINPLHRLFDVPLLITVPNSWFRTR